MKAKTKRLTRNCIYCECPITYRSEKAMKEAEKKGEHIHAVCIKARAKRKKELKKSKK